MNKIDKKKRIIIENIKNLEYAERIKVLQDLIEMYKAEMLIFGESKWQKLNQRKNNQQKKCLKKWQRSSLKIYVIAKNETTKIHKTRTRIYL